MRRESPNPSGFSVRKELSWPVLKRIAAGVLCLHEAYLVRPGFFWIVRIARSVSIWLAKGPRAPSVLARQCAAFQIAVCPIVARTICTHPINVPMSMWMWMVRMRVRQRQVNVRVRVRQVRIDSRPMLVLVMLM